MIIGSSLFDMKVKLQMCIDGQLAQLCSDGVWETNIDVADSVVTFTVYRTLFDGSRREAKIACHVSEEGRITKCDAECEQKWVQLLSDGALIDYLIIQLVPNLQVIRQLVYADAILSSVVPNLLNVKLQTAMNGTVYCMIKDELLVRLGPSDDLNFDLRGKFSELHLDCSKPEPLPPNFDFISHAFMYGPDDIMPQFLQAKSVATAVTHILRLLDPIQKRIDVVPTQITKGTPYMPPKRSMIGG